MEAQRSGDDLSASSGCLRLAAELEFFRSNLVDPGRNGQACRSMDSIATTLSSYQTDLP